jgi:hypothetical protein
LVTFGHDTRKGLAFFLAARFALTLLDEIHAGSVQIATWWVLLGKKTSQVEREA